jgi:hypothetical protein
MLQAATANPALRTRLPTHGLKYQPSPMHSSGRRPSTEVQPALFERRCPLLAGGGQHIVRERYRDRFGRGFQFGAVRPQHL